MIRRAIALVFTATVEVRNTTKDESYTLRHRLSPRQVEMITAGGLIAYQNSSVSGDQFGIFASLSVVTLAYIGGVGSTSGPTERIMAFFGGTRQDLHHRVVLFDRADPAKRLKMENIAMLLKGAIEAREGRVVLTKPVFGGS